MEQRTEKQGSSADQSELDKALKRVRIADRLRMFFMFTALLMVLFVFYGNKFAMETSWYLPCRGYLYNILFAVVLCMLIASVSKAFLAATYNRILKNTQKD